MVNHHVGAGMVAVALFWATGALLELTAGAQNATNEEVDAAVKFYDGVKADAEKRKAYCDVRQGIRMMTSDPKKFAEAQQKVSAATKQLGPEFGRAQNLQTRLDMGSDNAKRYISARQALDNACS